MATGTITRTIGTTFTVSGIQSAIMRLRRVAQSFTGNLQAMRAAAARYFAPILTGLKKISEFSFKALQKAASLAFKGIAAGAVLASLKVKAIAAAALESSKGIAELMNQISKDSRRLGISTRDLSALRFGFEKQGVDPEEVLQSLSDIGNEFKAIRQQIDAAGIPGGQDREGDLVTGRVSLNWQATPQDFIQVSGFWQGDQLLAQGTRESGGMLNLGYRRKLTDTVSLQVTGRAGQLVLELDGPIKPLAVSDAGKDRENRLAALNKEVAELNARFGGWTFVLPAYKYANINKSMEDLLKPLEEKKTAPAAAKAPVQKSATPRK
jgi:hypothetical protein